jgi:hypothetical protein
VTGFLLSLLRAKIPAKAPVSSISSRSFSGTRPISSSSSRNACTAQARDAARRQQALSWELRAATTLARLRRHQAAPPTPSPVRSIHRSPSRLLSMRRSITSAPRRLCRASQVGDRAAFPCAAAGADAVREPVSYLETAVAARRCLVICRGLTLDDIIFGKRRNPALHPLGTATIGQRALAKDIDRA